MERELEIILSNIREIRSSKKFSQENMAEELGIDPSTYSKIENGKIELTIVRLAELARSFQLRIIDIITWPDIYINENERPDQKKVKAVLQIELDQDKKEQVLKLVFGENNLEILNR